MTTRQELINFLAHRAANSGRTDVLFAAQEIASSLRRYEYTDLLDSMDSRQSRRFWNEVKRTAYAIRGCPKPLLDLSDAQRKVFRQILNDEIAGFYLAPHATTRQTVASLEHKGVFVRDKHYRIRVHPTILQQIQTAITA